MIQKKWFININDQILGPLEPAEIEKKLTSQPKALVWGRGFPEWVLAQEWRQKMNQPESTAQKSPVQITYRFRIAGVESETMGLDSLLKLLRSEPQVSSVQIWTSSTNDWNDIYAIEAVADELGMSRRSHPRVPIMGSYEGEGPEGSFKYSVVTISQGGMGLGEVHNLKIGDRLKGTLTSSNLFTSIFCFCEVVFVGGDGYIGLRFVALPTEAQSLIIEYVKKFGDLIQNN